MLQQWSQIKVTHHYTSVVSNKSHTPLYYATSVISNKSHTPLHHVTTVISNKSHTIILCSTLCSSINLAMQAINLRWQPPSRNTAKSKCVPHKQPWPLTGSTSFWHITARWQWPYLGDVCVVKQSEDDARQRIDHLIIVWWGDDLGQRVLQRVAQDAVKGKVRTVDLLLHPLVAAQVADLGPQAVQVLGTYR